MVDYRLTRRADNDIEAIYEYTIGEYGLSQAKAYIAGLKQEFEKLSQSPLTYRLRDEFQPPIRISHYQSHIIIYHLDKANKVEIIRVRHAREDWLPNS